MPIPQQLTDAINLLGTDSDAQASAQSDLDAANTALANATHVQQVAASAKAAADAKVQADVTAATNLINSLFLPPPSAARSWTGQARQAMRSSVQS